jgi:hypothetical protein
VVERENGRQPSASMQWVAAGNSNGPEKMLGEKRDGKDDARLANARKGSTVQPSVGPHGSVRLL